MSRNHASHQPLRATAQGLSFNFGRIFAAAGAIGAGRLLEPYPGDYARMGATITLIYILGAVIIWFAPEPKGRPLPDLTTKCTTID
jgi:MFS transporter, SHS family, sialic acid transporter